LTFQSALDAVVQAEVKDMEQAQRDKTPEGLVLSERDAAAMLAAAGVPMVNLDTFFVLALTRPLFWQTAVFRASTARGGRVKQRNPTHLNGQFPDRLPFPRSVPKFGVQVEPRIACQCVMVCRSDCPFSGIRVTLVPITKPGQGQAGWEIKTT